MFKDRWQQATLNFRIYAYLRQLMKEVRLPADEVRKLQFSRLKTILCDAYQTHPFYRERFDASHFDPYKMKDISELKRLPILEKEEYRDFINRTREEKGEKHFLHWYADSALDTKGNPFLILRNWDERAYMLAKWMRVLFLNGYNWRHVTFSLPSPNHIQRDSFVQRFGIFKRYPVAFTDPIEKQVKLFRKAKPSVVYGHKTYLVQLARHCSEQNIQLPEPDLCVSFGEELDDPSRKLLEKSFGSNCLMEIYGALEVAIMAYQIKGEDAFHVCHTTDILEILDDKGQDSSYGNGVLTDLCIRSFPMIRYNLNDMLDTKIVNGLSVINRIDRHKEDRIIFSDRKTVSWNLIASVFEGRSKDIKQYSIIQEDYNQIRIVVVKEEAADKSVLEEEIINDMRKHVRDEGVEYAVDFVDSLPLDSNGKAETLISKVT